MYWSFLWFGPALKCTGFFIHQYFLFCPAGKNTGIRLTEILSRVNINLPFFSLSPVFQVMADDVDQGQNGQVTYSIQSSGRSGLFKIDPITGSITTAAIMDREIFTQTKWEQICGWINIANIPVYVHNLRMDIHYRSKVWGHTDNFVSSMKTHFYLSNELKIE